MDGKPGVPAHRPPRPSIDVNKAVELWNIHRNWATVAAQMLAPSGRHYTPTSVYLAVWRADRLPEGAKRARPTREERDINEHSLSAAWRPGSEKWMPFRPCYRTNRIIANPQPEPPAPSLAEHDRQRLVHIVRQALSGA